MAYLLETMSDSSILNNIAPEWQDYIERQMKFLRNKSQEAEFGEAVAYYKPSCNQMFFPSIHLVRSWSGTRTIVHEYGHFVHHNAFDYDRTNNTIFYIFKKEVVKKKISNEEDGLKFLNHLRTECPLRWGEALCPISDALGIYFNTELFRNSNYRGHKKGYPSYYIGTELFANIFQMIIMGDNEGLSIFKREFPKTYYYLSKKINGLQK